MWLASTAGDWSQPLESIDGTHPSFDRTSGLLAYTETGCTGVRVVRLEAEIPVD